MTERVAQRKDLTESRHMVRADGKYPDVKITPEPRE